MLCHPERETSKGDVNNVVVCSTRVQEPVSIRELCWVFLLALFCFKEGSTGFFRKLFFLKLRNMLDSLPHEGKCLYLLQEKQDTKKPPELDFNRLEFQ